MAEDDRDLRGSSRATRALEQAASAASNAGTEFLTRMLEIGSRQMTDALVQALRPAQDQGASGRLEGLLARYRDALGEMALHLPLVARRLVQGQEQPNRDMRWMFRASLDKNRSEPDPMSWNPAVPPMPKLWEITQFVPRASDGVDARITKPVRKAFDDAISAVPGLTSAQVRDALLEASDDGAIRDIPRLLDRLKYGLRRNGIHALPDLRRELAWLQNPDLSKVLEFVAILKRALGEKCTRELLRSEVVAALVDRPEELRGTLFTRLKEAFEFAGVVLADRVSVVAERQRWIILDHDSDRAFEALPRHEHNERLLDVFGPAHCSYRATVRNPELLLPVRVHDASHGFAVWSVEKQRLQEHLNLRPSNALKAWDIGAGKTPLLLFMTEQREGDLGPYLELGLACVVTPRKDPLAVGLLVLHDIQVTAGMGHDASNRIWGARKAEAHLSFERTAQSATMVLSEKPGRRNPLLTFTLPRGGDGTSVDVPLFLYTHKGEVLHRTIITRSGTGELLRAGGTGLSLVIHDPKTTNSLCDDLHYFGVKEKGPGMPSRPPLFVAWSEHVSAQLPAPEIVYERQDED